MKCVMCGDGRVTELGAKDVRVQTFRCLWCKHIFVVCNECKSPKLTSHKDDPLVICCTSCGEQVDFND